MRKVLGPEFFERPALLVARELLGKYLVRRISGSLRTGPGRAGRSEAFMITETEAYFGFKDKGSHACRGQTPRNAPMFERGGTIYVYFTYGMHWMLNIVCGRKGFPAAVLIRGLQFPQGDTLRKLSGPGKLTKYLKVNKKLNSKPLSKKSGLWVEDRGIIVKSSQIKKTPRIGIPNRGIWTDKPWRFVLITPEKENQRPA